MSEQIDFIKSSIVHYEESVNSNKKQCTESRILSLSLGIMGGLALAAATSEHPLWLIGVGISGFFAWDFSGDAIRNSRWAVEDAEYLSYYKSQLEQINSDLE